jgi:hypothetical protein
MATRGLTSQGHRPIVDLPFDVSAQEHQLRYNCVERVLKPFGLPQKLHGDSVVQNSLPVEVFILNQFLLVDVDTLDNDGHWGRSKITKIAKHSKTANTYLNKALNTSSTK